MKALKAEEGRKMFWRKEEELKNGRGHRKLKNREARFCDAFAT